MAYPTSSEHYTSHISTTDNSISSGTHPSAANCTQYPKLYPPTEEVIYSTTGEPQPTKSVSSSQQHLLDRPTRGYHYSRSLTPAIIGMVHSAVPTLGMAEVGDLVQDLTELVRQCEKETRDRHAQQARWIDSLENHIRELNHQIASYQRTIQDVDSRLWATRLLDPQPARTGFLSAHYRSADALNSLPS